MKTANKKLLSQKGLSPIIIVIILAAVGVGAFVLLKGGSVTNNNSSSSQPTQSSQQTSPQAREGLDKVEDPAYNFYYPKGYVKGELSQDEAGNKDVLDYKNPKTKATDPEEILLRITKTDKKLIIPAYEQCQKLGETFRQKADDQITAEVARGGLGDGKGVGCKVTVKYQVPGVNDKSDFIEKQLWDSQAQQATIYKVRALYFENASSDQAKILDTAVNEFTLK